MRPLLGSEKELIELFADRLPEKQRAELLNDMRSATAEDAVPGGSRVVFFISGYDRPKYKGQHPFPVEGRVQDRDGAELSILLHADENDRLFELELIRWDEKSILDPQWRTLRVFAMAPEFSK